MKPLPDHNGQDLLHQFIKQNFTQHTADVLVRNTPIRLDISNPRVRGLEALQNCSLGGQLLALVVSEQIDIPFLRQTHSSSITGSNHGNGDILVV